MVSVNNAWKGSYKQKKEPPFKKMKVDTTSGMGSCHGIVVYYYTYDNAYL